MRKFATIESWLETNPSKDELAKVINLINKGVSHEVRRNLYEAENYLRKLYRSSFYLNKANFPMPKEIATEIEATKKKIEAFRKELPEQKIKPRKFVTDVPEVPVTE